MKRILLSLVILVSFLGHCLADSPLTSTEWWKYYEKKAVIQEATEYGCTKNVMKVVCGQEYPIDLRLAVVNALSWNFEGQHNFSLCVDYYQQAYQLSDEEIDSHIDAETYCVFAYLLALDNYFEVSDALQLALHAYEMKPQSRAISIITGLIAAQMAMDDNWCNVYTNVAPFAYDNTLIPDMSDYAVGQIMEYINLYAEYCDD